MITQYQRKNFIIKLFFCISIFILSANTAHSQTLELTDKPFITKLFVNYSVTTGRFADRWENGVGLGLLVEYRTESNLAFGALVGYTQWQSVFEDGRFELLYTDIPFLASIMYYFDDAESFRPYTGLEGGLHMHKYHVREIATNLDSSIDYNDFGFSVVAGLIVPFYDPTYLDVNIKYTKILNSSDNNNETGDNLNFIVITAGVALPF